ncbi:MAG: SUMF1/EgtB/PvdO family nonheme iron enzyme, partial [Bacteroidetes bacterium]|nr:SUMF1/EgtB/PvdO family nonheme iron enzyme [Bacteroidota bacterium]
KPGLNTLNEWINLNGRFGDEKCRINKLGENYSVEKGYENFPVIYVSWLGAIEYCKWREYRLPSEAEWEYAAGGGSENRTLWSTKNDEGELFNYAVFDNLRLAPVKSKIANKLGLYDMSGNVKEWCADQWHENYYNAPLDSSPWLSGYHQNRVVRGGSWSENSVYQQIFYRFNYGPKRGYLDIGFRVAKTAR